MNSINSPLQAKEGDVRPRVNENSNWLLRTCVLAISMQTSNPLLDRRLLESSPHSSSPSQTFHDTTVTAYREDRELMAESDMVFRLAANEIFEDGMENRASLSLKRFVFRYSAVGVQHLAVRLLSEHMNQAIAADIVRVLGQIEHGPSHNDRVYIAECLLYSKLPFARDSGAVALSDLADKCSIPALKRAIDAEEIPALKANMLASLNELVKASDAANS